MLTTQELFHKSISNGEKPRRFRIACYSVQEIESVAQAVIVNRLINDPDFTVSANLCGPYWIEAQGRMGRLQTFDPNCQPTLTQEGGVQSVYVQA